MTTYEQLNKLESELETKQWEIEELENQKEDLGRQLKNLEYEQILLKKHLSLCEASLVENDPDYRRYWGEKMTDYREFLNGQFEFKSQYAVCNGWVMAVFNNPIEGMPFCKGITIDLFSYRTTPLSIKTSEIMAQNAEQLKIGNVYIDKEFFNLVKKFLCLDDTAKYSMICDGEQGMMAVIVQCTNGEKALIMGRKH